MKKVGKLESFISELPSTPRNAADSPHSVLLIVHRTIIRAQSRPGTIFIPQKASPQAPSVTEEQPETAELMYILLSMYIFLYLK